MFSPSDPSSVCLPLPSLRGSPASWSKVSPVQKTSPPRVWSPAAHQPGVALCPVWHCTCEASPNLTGPWQQLLISPCNYPSGEASSPRPTLSCGAVKGGYPPPCPPALWTLVSRAGLGKASASTVCILVGKCQKVPCPMEWLDVFPLLR